jgi:hypothetical protein
MGLDVALKSLPGLAAEVDFRAHCARARLDPFCERTRRLPLLRPCVGADALRNADELARPTFLREPSVNSGYCGEVVLS